MRPATPSKLTLVLFWITYYTILLPLHLITLPNRRFTRSYPKHSRIARAPFCYRTHHNPPPDPNKCGCNELQPGFVDPGN